MKERNLLKLSVLFPEHVEVNGSPEAGTLPSDDHDCGGVDGQEDAGAAAAVPGMFDSFANPN